MHGRSLKRWPPKTWVPTNRHEIMVRRGEPVPVVLEVQEKVRAGAYPDGYAWADRDLSYLLMGSVTTGIVRESPVPVLTMRG